MGREYFEEVTEGFDPHVCHEILVRDYYNYEKEHEFYGGSIGTTDSLEFVKYYDKSLKQAERDREKITGRLEKRECAVQGFEKGYAIVKVEKHDNKGKARTRKYEVKVERTTSDGRDRITMPEYNEKFSSLREAKEYAEKLFRELPKERKRRDLLQVPLLRIRSKLILAKQRRE